MNDISNHPIKVLTTNVRVSEADDGPNNWELRKEYCLETILAQDADIICGQEVSPSQYAYLKEGLKGYDTYGLHETTRNRRAQNAIFYRRERFDYVVASGYWLSETPHVPGSRSWESACIRFANWVRLADRHNGGREFRVLTTHLDHVSHDARVGQANVINQDAAAYEEEFPQILTGDLNCGPGSTPIEALLAAGWQDSYGAIHGLDYPPSSRTFHRFEGTKYEGKLVKIDWVMARGALKAVGAEVVADTRDDAFYSDHYFLSGTFEFV